MMVWMAMTVRRFDAVVRIAKKERNPKKAPGRALVARESRQHHQRAGGVAARSPVNRPVSSKID